MEDRIEYLREQVDALLLAMENPQERRHAYLHLYGVAQACGMLAMKRGEDIASAVMAGMLHDLWGYISGDFENHGPRGAAYVREFLEGLNITTQEETEKICRAISCHSDKAGKYDGFTEVLIDADVLQHGLYNPVLPLRKRDTPRFKALMTELGIHS